MKNKIKEKLKSSPLILSAFSGLLLTASFPKADMDFIPWFALFPLLYALKDAGLKKGFRLGFTTGLIHYITLLYWLVYTMETYGGLSFWISVPLLFLLASYLAVFTGFFAMWISWPKINPIYMPFAVSITWVGLEYIKSWLFTGFPWELLGYSLYKRLYLIQIADIAGVYGVSFIIALGGGAFLITFLYLKKTPWHGFKITKKAAVLNVALFAIILALTISYGAMRIKSVKKIIKKCPEIKTALIQGNIDQTQKWNPKFQRHTVEKYINLSLSLKNKNPDLVVWPETALPFYLTDNYNKNLADMVKNMVKDMKVSFITGSPSYSIFDKRVVYHNSAYLVNPDGKITEKYDKSHLVPFGEYVPLKKWLPFIGKIVAQVGDFKAGAKGKILKKSPWPLGVLICYEIIFPDLSQIAVKNGAGLLVNITNDAWYGTSSAPYQHFSMAVFRAVENKRALVRAANTGISGFIGPFGEILDKSPLFRDMAMIRKMPVLTKDVADIGFYTKYGDFFARICVFLSFITGFLYIIKRRMENES